MTVHVLFNILCILNSMKTFHNDTKEASIKIRVASQNHEK